MIKIEMTCTRCGKVVKIDETNEKDLAGWANVNIYDEHCMYTTKVFCPECMNDFVDADKMKGEKK